MKKGVRQLVPMLTVCLLMLEYSIQKSANGVKDGASLMFSIAYGESKGKRAVATDQKKVKLMFKSNVSMYTGF